MVTPPPNPKILYVLMAMVFLIIIAEISSDLLKFLVKRAGF